MDCLVVKRCHCLSSIHHLQQQKNQKNACEHTISQLQQDVGKQLIPWRYSHTLPEPKQQLLNAQDNKADRKCFFNYSLAKYHVEEVKEGILGVLLYKSNDIQTEYEHKRDAEGIIQITF